LKIDGIPEPRWHCVLIHERKQPCKFEQPSQTPNAPARPQTQALISRLPAHSSSEPRPQPERTSEDLPSPQAHNTPNPPKPEPPLPNLPKMEAPRAGSRIRKRQRR
jgi:hypothetical protein